MYPTPLVHSQLKTTYYINTFDTKISWRNVCNMIWDFIIYVIIFLEKDVGSPCNLNVFLLATHLRNLPTPPDMTDKYKDIWHAIIRFAHDVVWTKVLKLLSQSVWQLLWVSNEIPQLWFPGSKEELLCWTYCFLNHHAWRAVFVCCSTRAEITSCWKWRLLKSVRNIFEGTSYFESATLQKICSVRSQCGDFDTYSMLKM